MTRVSLISGIQASRSLIAKSSSSPEEELLATLGTGQDAPKVTTPLRQCFFLQILGF